MKTIQMLVELTYDEEAMHGNCPDAQRWFMEDVLAGPAPAEGLYLHSGAIGDEVGTIRVLRVNAQADSFGDGDGCQEHSE